MIDPSRMWVSEDPKYKAYEVKVSEKRFGLEVRKYEGSWYMLLTYDVLTYEVEVMSTLDSMVLV